MSEELLTHILRLISRVFYSNPAVSIVMDYLCGVQKYLKFQVTPNGRKKNSPLHINNSDLDNALSILVEHKILILDTSSGCQHYEFNEELIDVLKYRLMSLKKAIDIKKGRVNFRITL